MEKEFSAIEVAKQLGDEFKLLQKEFKDKCDAFEKKYGGVTVMLGDIEGFGDEEYVWGGLAIDFDALEKMEKLFKAKPLISGSISLVDESRIVNTDIK